MAANAAVIYNNDCFAIRIFFMGLFLSHTFIIDWIFCDLNTLNFSQLSEFQSGIHFFFGHCRLGRNRNWTFVKTLQCVYFRIDSGTFEAVATRWGLIITNSRRCAIKMATLQSLEK